MDCLQFHIVLLHHSPTSQRSHYAFRETIKANLHQSSTRGSIFVPRKVPTALFKHEDCFL